MSKKRTEWSWKAFLPEGSDRHHPAANVFGPKSRDISGLKFPKIIVFMGGFDPLRDWQKRFCEGMKRNGKEVKVVDYPNAIHCFYAFPELPESTLFIRELKDFIFFSIVLFLIFLLVYFMDEFHLGCVCFQGKKIIR